MPEQQLDFGLQRKEGRRREEGERHRSFLVADLSLHSLLILFPFLTVKYEMLQKNETTVYVCLPMPVIE